MLGKLQKVSCKLIPLGILVPALLIYSLQRQNLNKYSIPSGIYHNSDTLNYQTVTAHQLSMVESQGNYLHQFQRKHQWRTQDISSENGMVFTIYMLHAYHDDRPLLNGQKFIRIFTIIPKDAYHTLAEKLFCHFGKTRKRSPATRVIADVRGVDGARRLAVNNTIFWNVLVSCPVTTIQTIITSVSITQNPHIIADIYLNVTYPKHPSIYEHRYGMCQSNGVLYGKIPDDQATWLIEWFEINQLFGITEFNLYNSTVQVSDVIRRVLLYYQAKGLLKLHQVLPPFRVYSKEDRNASEIPMKVALNDCLYRNMYRYEYTVVIDIDEVIVPQVHNNYDSLVEYLKPKIKVVDGEFPSISFGSYAFYKTYPKNETTLERDLNTNLYTYYNNQEFKKKSFLNSRHCLSGFSHFCLKPLSSDKISQQKFRPTISAAVHHYREECVSQSNQRLFNSTMCQSWQLQKELNTRMYHFTDKLSQRVKHVKQHLNIQ